MSRKWLLLPLALVCQYCELVRSLPLQDVQFSPEENIGVREYLSEGDIRISRRRNAVRDFYQTWINRTVPYTMEKLNNIERQMVLDAMHEIQNNSCVYFLERTTQIDYITIVKHEGCSSSVGRRGGQQMVILGEGCYVKGVILHELMHALGFWHEHSRPDRDDFISIVWENIALEHRSNFEKYDTSSIDTLDTVYDYGSIMHYKNNTFAINRTRITINATRPIPPGVEMGQRVKLSQTDVTKLKRLYRCNITHCADPGIPKNGVRIGGDFAISKTVNYSCGAQYTLFGSRGRYCMDNGQWTGNLPSCLPNPLNGLSGLHYCDFDGRTLCGWTQDTNDERNWMFMDRPTPSNGTGPVEDHTMGSAEGWYIYLETSSPTNTGDRAKLTSPVFNFGNTRVCLVFYYCMNGKNMGSLSVHQMSSYSGQMSTVFIVQGDQGTDWLLAYLRLEPGSSFQIVFDAQAGNGYTSDIAVDDVVVAPCDNLQALDKDAVAETMKCSFDADMCHWTQDISGDAFDWTRNSGGTQSFQTGPACDPLNCVGGSYLYIEASAPRVSGDRARIMTPLLHGDGPRCLQFFYSMYGGDIGALEVYVLRADGRELEHMWGKNGDQGDSWNTIRLDFLAPVYYKLVFEGVVGGGYRGDIAIDNVEVMVGECSDVVLYDCTFEYHTCSWENQRDDQRDWTRINGTTPTPYTGPTGDHTTGSGYYMFVESSRTRPGDKARLMSAVISGQFPGYCLQVWYHMYGADMGTLRLATRTVTTGRETPFWTISGDQGNFWHHKSIFLTSPGQDFRVIFEAELNGAPRGLSDVAIDDVSIHAGQCEPVS